MFTSVPFQLVFVGAIACLKLLQVDTENEDHLHYARIFFGIFHLFFLLMFLQTKSNITAMMATQEEKLDYGSQLKGVVKGILLKALVIGVVHYKTNLIQPLVISSFMGFMALLECNITYDAVSGVLPFLFSAQKTTSSKKNL